tara:strand:+ start:140 stop:628 length:489 start_codon:yes stop_codon:yes gene_type:complete
MNINIRDIALIFFISFVIGIMRALILKDIDIIKVESDVVNILSEDLFTSPQFIDIDLSKKMYDQGAIFIDARDVSTFNEGHIKNSFNIPWDSLSNDEIIVLLEDIPYDQIVVTYCSGGDCTLSLDLADFMFDELGYEKVLIFEGGYPKWLEKHYPTEGFKNE